ncbi:MAG: hypothetical protein FWC36_05340 [Spirochaetes bacterium]|nr:hypothetical protein [Spirochaetota bacterium]
MKYKKVLVLCLFLALPTMIFAQTAQEIENLLNAPNITWARAASFVLRASEHGNFNEADAFRFAAERRWLPSRATPDGAAQLSGVAKLMLESFNMRGGIMYSLTGHRRYAYRELVHRNIIQGRTSPAMLVSGAELLFMIGNFLSIQEAQEEGRR